MPASPDRLAKDFVECALELHRRRLWREVQGDAIFLVRLPTEELPLAANVMGQMGQEFGLGLARGEGAFRRMAGPYLERAAMEEFTDAGDLLSVMFAPWGTLPDEFRKLYTAAGFQARRDRSVPMTLIKRPYEIPRPAGRGDLRTLLWALRGVLAAHDAGEFCPTSLSDLNRSEHRVLEIEIGGKPRKPTVTTRFVPWPEDADALDLPPLVALPADLRTLPRVDQRWLLARVHMAAEISGDARSMFGIFVAEESSGLILSNAIAMGDELAPAAQALTEAFRGEGDLGSENAGGLPREIVFDSPRLHAAFAPVLTGFGIRAELDEECPALIELSTAFQAAEFSTGEDGEPQLLQEWKDNDRNVTSQLVEETLGTNAPVKRAMKRYFGTLEEEDEVLEQLDDSVPFGAFAEWLAADYRATSRSKTKLEKRLAKKRLDPVERRLLQARVDAVLSIFRVDSCEPGATLDVEDVLTGKRYLVHDAALSGCDLEGIFLPLRLLRIFGWYFPVIAGPALTPLNVNQALEELERLTVELTPEGLRRDAHLLGRLWSWQLTREEGTPILTNTDGEPLEFQTATFRITDSVALERALGEREHLDVDTAQGGWVWTRDGATSDCGNPIVLGHLDILDDRLVLEVNSLERLELAREWLETIPGVRFERATAHGLDASDLPLDDRLPDSPSEPLPPEVADEVEHTLRDIYFRWLDERVPMLGDRTPREACATQQGRRQVARLVRTMFAMGTPDCPLEVPREELLRELGISE